LPLMTRMWISIFVVIKKYSLLIFYSDDDERKTGQDSDNGKRNVKSVSFVRKKRAQAQEVELVEDDDDDDL